jgi:hypothetical protein
MSLATQISALATAIGAAVKLRLLKSANLSDVADRQIALNNLTNIGSATNEHVLTKDGSTGHAIWKVLAAVGGSSVSVISTNTTATKGNLYVLTASLTLTLPVSPTAGDSVKVSNLSGTTTPVVARNGEKIMGLAEDLILDKLNSGFELNYINATVGWVII